MKKIMIVFMMMVMMLTGTVYANDNYQVADYKVIEDMVGKNWAAIESNIIPSNGNIDRPIYMEGTTYSDGASYYDEAYFGHCYRNIMYSARIDQGKVVSASMNFDTFKDTYEDQMFETYRNLLINMYGQPTTEQGSFFTSYMWKVNGKRIAIMKVMNSEYSLEECAGNFYMNINVETINGNQG